jgi:hypothetical protein
LAGFPDNPLEGALATKSKRRALTPDGHRLADVRRCRRHQQVRGPEDFLYF